MQPNLNRNLLLCLLVLPGLTSAHVAAGGDNVGPVRFFVQHAAPPLQAPYFLVVADLGQNFQPPVVAIRSEAVDHGRRLSMQDRAEMIRKRLYDFQAANPHWFMNLKPMPYQGEIVIAQGSPKNYIATADAKSVTPMNCRSREELAKKLVVMIQKALKVQGQKGSSRAEAIVGASTPENLVLQGDGLMETAPAQAVEKYKAAADQTDGKYVYADLCLVRYYIDHDDKTQASDYLKKAKAQPLTPEQSAQVKELEKDLGD